MKTGLQLLWIGLLIGSLVPRTPAAEDPAPRSLEDVQQKVAALRQEDVAWRKIAWHTCLLEGLRESREQGKPVVLWIFIDRPIDDERC